MSKEYSERVNAVVEKLQSRDRFGWAARIYGASLERRLADVSRSDPPSHIDWLRYGNLLLEAGDPIKASAAFRRSVQLKLKTDGALGGFVCLAMRRWTKSLEAAGMPKSATEARELLEKIGNRLAAEQNATILAPSRLLAYTVSRCTFSCALRWEDPDERFRPQADGSFLVLRERFRFDDGEGPWLEFEASAPAEEDPHFPHMRISVTFPGRLPETASAVALALVNEMNRDNADASTCLDPETGRISVRALISFTGFNETETPDSDLDFAQREMAFNTMLGVFGVVRSWEARVSKIAHDAPAAE